MMKTYQQVKKYLVTSLLVIALLVYSRIYHRDIQNIISQIQPTRIIKDSNKLLSSAGSNISQIQPTRTIKDSNKLLSSASSNKIYGHIHIAKTGGTFVNEALANKYRGVCGNKGHSLYYYYVNQMMSDAKANITEIHLMKRDIHGHQKQWGFEECDYISREDSYTSWNQSFPGGELHGVPIELHVPCRDAVEHIMSLCSWNEFQFNCDNITDEKLFRAIDVDCRVFTDRFNLILSKNFDIKCFDSKRVTEYIEYMSNHLLPRRFVSEPFIYTEPANWKMIDRGNHVYHRNKSNECIWSRPDLLQKVGEHLLSGDGKAHHYYQFCNKCLGSENDLLE
jgi:hypothetical protein